MSEPPFETLMSRCATDPGYNFRGCVKASVVTRLGCRPEWDPEPAEVPLVHHPPADQVTPAVDSEAISYELYFREYESRFLYISQIEERAVLKETGCLPPCELSSFEDMW